MEDKRIKKYFENMPYGDDAKSSEIHGKHSQKVINGFISGLVKKYDVLWASGDKERAGHIDGAIKGIARQLDNLREIKKEFGVNYGGGVGGKNMFSNYTDLNWDRAFFGERGAISFGEDFKIILTAIDPNGEEISKGIEDITENWVIKGGEEAKYMQMHQDLIKQGQTAAKHPDFNIDWAVDNLLLDNDAWKIFVSDKIGGVYFLHIWMQENQEAINAGQFPDEMLHPDSFHPESDMRLYKHYSDRLKRAFDPNYKSIRDGSNANSTIDSRATMSEDETVGEQPKKQVEGPLSAADNRVPDIKQ